MTHVYNLVIHNLKVTAYKNNRQQATKALYCLKFNVSVYI